MSAIIDSDAIHADQLRAIVPGLPAEVVVWIADVLEDGSRSVRLHEIRVLADRDEPGAHNGGSPIIQRVARIAWRADSGEIMHLWVRPGLRREGVATRLYQAAQAITGNAIQHSPYRTAEGEAWAQSLGEPLPKWRLA